MFARMHRTVAALLATSVTAGLLTIAFPAGASAAHECKGQVFGRPGFSAKIARIHARQVSCPLARKLGRHSMNRINGRPKLFYRWHSFRCNSREREAPLPYLHYHCEQGTSVVKFALLIP